MPLKPVRNLLYSYIPPFHIQKHKMKTLFCLILLNILLAISLTICGANSINYNNQNHDLIENVTILGDMILSEDQWQDMIEEIFEEDFDAVSDINDTMKSCSKTQPQNFSQRYQTCQVQFFAFSRYFGSI